MLISREKKSIEVKNTDAGRQIILADCLAMHDLDADIIIELCDTYRCVCGGTWDLQVALWALSEVKTAICKENVPLKSGELAHI